MKIFYFAALLICLFCIILGQVHTKCPCIIENSTLLNEQNQLPPKKQETTPTVLIGQSISSDSLETERTD